MSVIYLKQVTHFDGLHRLGAKQPNARLKIAKVEVTPAVVLADSVYLSV